MSNGWNFFSACFLLVGLFILSDIVEAGDFEEGFTAYQSKDYAKAIQLFKSSAEKDDTRAYLWLAKIYSEGTGVGRDGAEAVKWTRKAAEANDAEAQFLLGTMYEEGRGVSKDSGEAKRWFQKAAQQFGERAKKGDATAQVFMGTLQAKGVVKVSNREPSWFDKMLEQAITGAATSETIFKAAEQGDAGAQLKLGLLCLERLGLCKTLDYLEAQRKGAEWIRKAAEQGHPEAQRQLGLLHREGRGVAKDQLEAAKWIQRAAASGNADAKKNLTYLLRDVVSNGEAEVVEFLLGHGMDVNEKFGSDERTALMVAILSGRLETVKTLLAHGADVNVKDKQGRTALAYAISAGHAEMVQLLKESGAKE